MPHCGTDRLRRYYKGMADAHHLREQMDRCRRLARSVADDRANRELLSMAAELESQIASQVEQPVSAQAAPAITVTPVQVAAAPRSSGR
jgi:hypothetical protein